MPAETQTISSKKTEKPKQTKQKISITKTLKLLPRKQNLILFNIPISQICSKTIFVSEIGPGFDLQDPKKIIGLEDRLNQKMTDIFLIKLINLINSRF